MIMNIVKVDEEKVRAKDLFKSYHEGARFICAKCGNELVYAFTREEAAKQGISPGMHCPKNLSHVNIHFNIR